jgi:TolB-like protein
LRTRVFEAPAGRGAGKARSIAVLPFADIFAIQDEIMAAIVDSLKVALKLGERAVLRKRSTRRRSG